MALSKSTKVTSFKAALVVGTILALINYGDRFLLRTGMASWDWVKVAITYCVPYCVATYGVVSARCNTRRANKATRRSQTG